jgi:transcription initiation factor IIE alpha subunit
LEVKNGMEKKRKLKTKLLLEYKVDLAKIDGRGDFPCPKCGVKMSPDDQTENMYSIKEIKTRRDRLEELVIQCHTCESLIHLAGFKLLDSLECDA